jgi:hypothetical protein
MGSPVSLLITTTISSAGGATDGEADALDEGLILAEGETEGDLDILGE